MQQQANKKVSFDEKPVNFFCSFSLCPSSLNKAVFYFGGCIRRPKHPIAVFYFTFLSFVFFRKNRTTFLKDFRIVFFPITCERKGNKDFVFITKLDFLLSVNGQSVAIDILNKVLFTFLLMKSQLSFICRIQKRQNQNFTMKNHVVKK